MTADDITSDAYYRGKRDAEIEFDAWKGRVTEMAHEYANEYGFGRQFDDFMVKVGLRPRIRAFDVAVEMTVELNVRVEAHSEDAAKSAVNDTAVAEALADLGRYGTLPSYFVGDVEAV